MRYLSSNLLSVDPGGTTGWSLWFYDAQTPLQHVSHGMVEGGLDGFLRWFDDTIEPLDEICQIREIVIEDFILDGRTLTPDTTALEIIGAVKHAVWGTGTTLTRQRNTYKAHADDATLKRLGFWWPGVGHDRDSARHALAYVKTHRHMPSIRAFWPPKERA